MSASSIPSNFIETSVLMVIVPLGPEEVIEPALPPWIMQDILGETYGVMVYQEDVIKVAHYFAGLSLGEADMLRRGMSGKFRSREEFAKVKQQFFDNCKEKGYTDELTAEIWRQTESFAGYAFSKGHSASYAVESYQSLYLRAHHPMRNLELLYSMNPEAKTLLDILDHTLSPMGARMLKRWIAMPLKELKPIQERLDSVESFLKEDELRDEVIRSIQQIGDLERLCSKLSTARINPREMLQLSKALGSIDPISSKLKKLKASSLKSMNK